MCPHFYMDPLLTLLIINFRKNAGLVIKVRELLLGQDVGGDHLQQTEDQAGERPHSRAAATPTCLISHFSGSEILVSLFRSSVSSCSTSAPWPRFRLLGRSGFLMDTSSLPSGPTFLLLLGFKSSPVSWSTSCQTEEEEENHAEDSEELLSEMEEKSHWVLRNVFLPSC